MTRRLSQHFVLAAEQMSDTIPTEGMAMGAADAPVTVVEWGDYT